MVPIIPKQRQTRPNAAKRFNDLIDYLQGEQEQAREGASVSEGLEQDGSVPSPLAEYAGRPAQPNEFSELLDYATAPTDTKVKGEKCVGIRTHGVDCIETASAEMNAVSRKNPRVLDPVYHFILSWPEHEKPAHAAIFDAAVHAIGALGFEAHQYVIAIHANTDNVHAHVAVNRVHPVTFKSHHIEWAKRTLHFAARESEIKHGWSHDNGIYVVEVDGHGKKQIVLNTKHIDAAQESGVHAHPDVERDETLPTWHDPDSLSAWLKSTVGTALKEELSDLTSWQALHVWLEHYGITLKDTGGGGLRMRAVSPDTGEILEIPVSKGLRQLKRPELEKRWGDYKALFTNPVIAPDFAGFTQSEIEKGIENVLANDPAGEFPPPDDLAGLAGDAFGSVPEDGGGLHAVPDRSVATGGLGPALLVPDPSQVGLGDREAGEDPGMRSPDSAGGRGRGEGRQGVGQGDPVAAGADGARRRPRDPEKRAQRKAERAAERLDLRRRYVQYRAFVAGGDTDYFARQKALRAERSREINVIRSEAKAAKAAVPKALSHETRLVSLIEIDAEVARRRLAIDAQYQTRIDALRATRVPPLAWREWLFEQANRADKAALSALRGIVYQAKRDAKLPSEEDEEDLDVAAGEYHDQHYKRLMARLLAEERKELAIRAASVHAMRPHEVDALLLAYAGVQWRVTGNGNIEYSKSTGAHLFTDRGNRVTFDRERVTDQEIQLALVHSREKFGHRVTLTGDDPVFVQRMVRLADDMGLTIFNPELQAAVQAHRAARKEAAGEAARSEYLRERRAAEPDGPAVEVALPTPQPIESSAPARDEDRLRAMVLAIDPRAKFHEADANDVARRYVGPVAAFLAGDTPMFAQHIGRGDYVIHRHIHPTTDATQIAEVRYVDGAMTADVRGTGPEGLER
jgi:hypothetical protein